MNILEEVEVNHGWERLTPSLRLRLVEGQPRMLQLVYIEQERPQTVVHTVPKEEGASIKGLTVQLFREALPRILSDDDAHLTTENAYFYAGVLVGRRSRNRI